MRKFTSVEVAQKYIEEICNKYSMSEAFKASCFIQVKKLGEIYGENEIPKEDFLTVFSRSFNSLRTGYKRTPVDIEEFILGVEYLNLEQSIRPQIKEELINLFTDYNYCYEALLCGSVRWGKTYFSCVGMAYQAYKLSCLYDPQAHYSLSPGSEIVFSFQSINETKAKRNFREFASMVYSSKYFKENFPPQGKSKNYMVFPNNILVKPVASNNTAVMSENIFSAFIDEANFMKVMKGSRHQGLDEDYYDQATKLYTTVKDRIQNQFKDFSTGEWPGKLYLASSANHTEDFIQVKKEEAQKLKDKGEHCPIYVMDYPLWEVKPNMNPSDKKFWVEMPGEDHAGKILKENPEKVTENIIEVPVELKDQFENDLHGSIRNVAGRPLKQESKFIPVAKVLDNTKLYHEHYGSQQIFSTQEVSINEVINIPSLLNIPFIEAINNFGRFHAHLDMSYKEDSAGLGIGCVMGAKQMEARQIYNEETEDYEFTDEYMAPIYVIFGLLRINPPENGEIDFTKVTKLFHAILQYLGNLKSFTADRAYSAPFFQYLREQNVSTNSLSVERNIEPYYEAKHGIIEDRLWTPEHEKYKEEIKNLQLDAKSGKVDHNFYSSNDLTDCVAGIVYTLSKRKMTWKKKDYPVTFSEMKKLSETKKGPKISGRPESKNRSDVLNRRKRR